MRFLQPSILLFFILWCAITPAGYGQVNFPSANFQLSVNSGCVPLTVSFTNTSQHATQYQWDFGNGGSSLVAQPSILYSTSGVFDVTLIAKDAAGNSDTMTLTNAVTVNNIPTANFSYTVNNICLGTNQVSFSNLSTAGINYTWDFGDGNSSTLSNPLHSYADSGNYTVNLMVTDNIGCSNFHQSTQAIRIVKEPELNFTVNDSVGCDTSSLFSFRCLTDSLTSWHWSFGDGDTSVAQQPTHKYASAGKYTVKLIATNRYGCSDTLRKSNFIQVDNKLNLNFTATNTNGCTPLATRLIANSAAAISAYQWRLGDGRTLQGNRVPTTYDSTGDYTVTFLATKANGCVDSITKVDYIQVSGGAVASFTADSSTHCEGGTVRFNNTSQHAVTSTFVWDFGDNITSTAVNPMHTYARKGTYNVSLTLTDSSSCTSTYSKIIQVHEMKAGFTAFSRSGCLPLIASFQDQSLIADSWFWDFGDGDTSHQRNPSHTYLSSGKFDVSLIIGTTSGCSDTLLLADYIQSFDDTLHTSLSDTIEGCLPLPIDFTDNQLGSQSWVWDFGNGDTSMIRNPSYTYQNPGTYTVSLQTFSSHGCPIFIQNYATIKIDSIIPNISVIQFDCQGSTIQLSDSTPNVSSWFWNFGDGTYSTLQSPIHRFPDSIVYDISLTLITTSGCVQSIFFPSYIDFTSCLVGGQAPVAGAGGTGSPNTADTIRTGNLFTEKCAPQIVQLSSPDTNAFSWQWDFGDGGTSALEHPIHIYRVPGLYDVQLITQNPSGIDTIFWSDYILVNGPDASFQSSVLYDCDSVTVSFSNTSQRVDTWSWSFKSQRDSSTISPSYTLPYSSRNHIIRLNVKDSAGCSSSKISILNFPKDEFIFTTPDSSCVGDTLQFSASDTSASYVWRCSDGGIDSSRVSSHVFLQAGIYAVQVTSKNAMGCETVHQLDSILVKGASAQFQILDTADCVNQHFSFVPNDLNADSYFWDLGGNITGTDMLPSVKLTQVGTYHVSLTVNKDGCANTYTNSTAVEVKGVNADYTVTQLNHCYPMQIRVQDTSSNVSQREWVIGGTALGNVTQHTFTTTDTSIFMSLKVTAQNGCVDSSSSMYEPSVLTSNFNISDTVGCAPLAVSFTNNAAHAVDYLWDFGDGDTSSLANPNHIYPRAGLYSVQLITKTADGCVDTTRHTNAVRVSSVQANYGISFNSTCAPMLVNFTDSSINAISWKWNFGDGTSSTARNPMKIYNNSGKFNVMLVVQNASGCADTLFVVQQIHVPGPITKFSMSDSVACGTVPIQFTDSSVNATRWSWFFGDGNTSNQQHPTHTYTVPGQYTVTLTTTDAAGCTGYYTFPKSIKMNNIPTANFQISDTVGCVPFAVQLTSQSLNASIWKWDLGNGNTSQDSLLSYTFDTPGSYSISLKVENSAGCSDSIQLDSVRALYTPKSQISPVDPICNNGDSVQLLSEETGGTWYGKGIVNHQTGVYHPKLVQHGIDTVIYGFQGVCPSSDTLEIQIKEAPEVDFTADKIEGCYQLPVELKTVFLKQLSPQATPTYSWEENGVSIGNSSQVNKTFQPGIYDLKLSVSLANGCEAKVEKPAFIKVYDSLPSITEMKRVSVVNDYQVLVEWHENVDVAFNTYEIYRKAAADSTFQKIKTISVQAQTAYIDDALNTLTETYCYKVVSVDKCGQELDLSVVPFHCTINVSSSKMDKNKVDIQWTDYIGCTVDFYEISRLDKTTNRLEQIARVSANQLSFVDTSAYCDYQYSYQIKAVGSLGLLQGSTSDTSEVKMNGISQLQTSEIIRATVQDNSSVLVEWTAVEVAPEFATGYVLHRSLDNKNFSPLTFVPMGLTSYDDWNTDVGQERYFYKIEVINTCQSKNEITNTGSSILLKSTQIDNYSGKINWTGYEKWEEGVKGYEIQRLNEFNQWETIQILPPNRRELMINF